MIISALDYINFLGGLALFLFSMEFLGGGMKKLSSGQLKLFLNLVTKNRVGGLLFGFFFTLLFQSSSAATVVLVGFINSGILTLYQTLPVLLGSGVGTTVAAQLISLKLSDYSLALVALGVIPFLLTKGRYQAVGKVFISIGLIFFSINIMTASFMKFRELQVVVEVTSYLNLPLIGFLFGLIVTATIHSSAGFIGLLIVFGSSGLITFTQTLPMIIGANIGTTATAHFAAINADRDAKIMANFNTLFRVLTAFVLFFFIDFWETVTLYISGNQSDLSRLVANAHTLFNLFMVFLLFPLLTPIVHFSRYLWRASTPKPIERLKYLNDEILETPEYFIPLLKKEVNILFDETNKMLNKSFDLFSNKDERIFKYIQKKEDKIDLYKEELSRVILKVNTRGNSNQSSREIFIYLHVINELEQISDIISVNVVKLAKKWHVNDISFSEQGAVELKEYHDFCTSNLVAAQQMFLAFPQKTKKFSINRKSMRMFENYGYNLEVNHYKRLISENINTQESSEVHVELLNQYRIINGRIIGLTRLLSHYNKNNSSLFF